MPLFLVVTILSLLFRISYLQLVEFKADEAIALFLASKPFFGHSLAMGSSVSSVGIVNPPFFVYLLTPFAFLSSDPRFISGVIGLINAISIGLFYILIKRYYGLKTALFSSLLFAFSPWAIFFSRKIWAQDVILPIFIILLFSFYKITVDKKKSYWFLYSTLTLFLLQIHQSLLFFLIPFNIFLLFKKPRYDFPRIALGILVGFIPLIPYVFFEIKYNFLDIRSLLLVNERFVSSYSFNLFARPFQIMHQGDFFPFFGQDIIQFAKEYSLLYKLRFLFYSEYLLLPVGAFLFWKIHKENRLFVHATLLLPFLYFIFHVNSEMHYFIILIPFLFLFLGTAFSYLSEKKLFLKLISLLLFSILIILSISFDFSFFNFLQKNNGLKGIYGNSFHKTDQITKQKIKQFEGSKDYTQILITTYIPKSSVVNGTSLLLYDRLQTTTHLTTLHKYMEKNPVDPRKEYELLAYYTAFPPAVDDVNTLRGRYKNNSSYGYIYNRVYEIYLYNHLKQVYENTFMNIGFEYPRHFKIDSTKTGVAMYGDGFTLYLKQVPYSLPNSVGSKREIIIMDQKVEETTCAEKNIWCGTFFEKLHFKNGDYALYILPNSEQIKILSAEFNNVIKNVQTIIASFRYLEYN